MKTAVIYGAATTAKRVYEEVKSQYAIQYFVDGNPAFIGTRIDGLEVKGREAILEARPDLVVMGILTGYEDAVEYLIQNGFPEERIICRFVDLNTRARRDCLEKIAMILEDKEVSGAVAELGVYRGDFAKVINTVFPERKLYLFDTFEGFPEEDMNYETENNLLLNTVGKLSNTSVEYVMGRMPHPERCVIRKGYFPETAAGLEDERYAFVNIDVDLYKPILAGLEYFWPRMAENGYIFVHDYFSFSYAGTKKAIEEFSERFHVGFTPIGDTLSVAFVKKGRGTC
ncbi:TylF/MycF/NovP-related O-methyltransferase [Otoolea muris]|uniref:TylF/MycF/NovP-related O-methyltransferase n=1 Tax=Otoolea muris TaxID=2941515 RepID=UPI00203B691A|nr:TylF/MycF/NovP-related O-methyltransferase [Otoolea muris]